MRNYDTYVAMPVQDLAESVTAPLRKNTKYPIGNFGMPFMMMGNKSSFSFTAKPLKFLRSTVHYYYKAYFKTGCSQKIVYKKPQVNILFNELK